MTQGTVKFSELEVPPYLLSLPETEREHRLLWGTA